MDLPACGDGQMARFRRFGGLPVHLSAQLEVLKGIAPRLDRIPAQHGVPIECVDRKPRVLDSREHSGKMHILNVSVRAKLHFREPQRHFALHASAKGFRKEVRYHKTIVVDVVVAPAGEARGVENGVIQKNVAPGVATRSLVLAVRKAPSPRTSTCPVGVSGERMVSRISCSSTQPRYRKLHLGFVKSDISAWASMRECPALSTPCSSVKPPRQIVNFAERLAVSGAIFLTLNRTACHSRLPRYRGFSGVPPPSSASRISPPSTVSGILTSL